MKISSVKIAYVDRRWSFGVKYEGCQFEVRAGTGDTQEEAFQNALEQVVRDAETGRVTVDTSYLESALAAHNERRMVEGLKALEFDQLPPKEQSQVMSAAQRLKGVVTP